MLVGRHLFVRLQPSNLLTSCLEAESALCSIKIWKERRTCIHALLMCESDPGSLMAREEKNFL